MDLFSGCVYFIFTFERKSWLKKKTKTKKTAVILFQWQVCEKVLLQSLYLLNEPPRGKTNNVVSEQIRHKPACHREADLRLCFRLCRLLVFPWGGSNLKVCVFSQLNVSSQPDTCMCSG